MTKTTLFPKCPACEVVLEDATGVGTKNAPSPGAASVCVYCAKLLRFTDTLDLRAMTGDELIVMDADDKRKLLRAQDTVLATLAPRLRGDHVRYPSWAKDWMKPAPPPPKDGELADWVRARPPKIRALMKRFPPQCLVRALRPLKIPSPGHPGIVFSHTENGDAEPGLSIIDNPTDPGFRGMCEPGWVTVIGFHEGVTIEWVIEVLGGKRRA